MANLDETDRVIETSQEVAGWSVKTLQDEKRKEECIEWHQEATGLSGMRERSSMDDIKKEAE